MRYSYDQHGKTHFEHGMGQVVKSSQLSSLAVAAALAASQAGTLPPACSQQLDFVERNAQALLDAALRQPGGTITLSADQVAQIARAFQGGVALMRKSCICGPARSFSSYPPPIG